VHQIKIHQSNEQGTRRNINREAVYTPPAFHPKALRLIYYLAGLLACFMFTAFPSRSKRDSGRSVNSFSRLWRGRNSQLRG